MPSVPTTTSTSPSRPASATAPRPPGPSAPVAVRLVDHDAARRSAGASSTISASGATSPSIEKTDVGDDQRRARPPACAQAPREVLDVAVVVDERLGARRAGSRR